MPINSDQDLQDAKRAVLAAVIGAFREKPPTIAVIGMSGAGKSSTLNALFGQKLPVSHAIRGTTAFTRIELSAKPKDESYGTLPFIFMDAPGLGEDVDRDPEYLIEYDKYLPECDVILWVAPGRNRALAMDQQYMRMFKEHAHKMVLGINQIDLIHPVNWNTARNLPSDQQFAQLDEIVSDRRDRLSRIAGVELPTVAYSASHRWRLVELLNTVLSRCGSERKFMFDLLSHVKPDDFLPRTLSESDRKRIEQAMRRNDEAKSSGQGRRKSGFISFLTR